MDESERLDRLETIVATIAEGTAVLINKVDKHDEEIAALRQLSLKNEEHIGIVVRMMDDWIRAHGKDNNV